MARDAMDDSLGAWRHHPAGRGVLFSWLPFLVTARRRTAVAGDPAFRDPFRGLPCLSRRRLRGGAALAECADGLGPRLGVLALRQRMAGCTAARGAQFA